MAGQDYTLIELMTVAAAREIKDGDIVFAVHSLAVRYSAERAGAREVHLVAAPVCRCWG